MDWTDNTWCFKYWKEECVWLPSGKGKTEQGKEALAWLVTHDAKVIVCENTHRMDLNCTWIFNLLEKYKWLLVCQKHFFFRDLSCLWPQCYINMLCKLNRQIFFHCHSMKKRYFYLVCIHLPIHSDMSTTARAGPVSSSIWVSHSGGRDQVIQPLAADPCTQCALAGS